MVIHDCVVMSTAYASDLRDFDRRALAEHVAAALDAVRRRGDGALPGGGGRRALRLTPAEVRRCVDALPATLLDDIRLAQDRLRQCADAERMLVCDRESVTALGARFGVRHVPVHSAGICAPATPGSGALHALQSAVIAARAAGVGRIVACVPGEDGRAPTPLVAALALAGADELYLAGGARALAGLTFGTESLPRVESVVGAPDPSLQEAARQLACLSPSRLRPGVLVIAEEGAHPELIAADLSSAHACGPEGRGVLVTTSPALAARVPGAIERQLELVPRGDPAQLVWHRHGAVRLVADRLAACRLADRYGFECVQVVAAEPRWYLNRLRRCRHVLLGAAAGAAVAQGLLRPAPGLWGVADAASVGGFMRTISYREHPGDVTGDEGAFARLRRLAGVESLARACEVRLAQRGPAPVGLPVVAGA